MSRENIKKLNWQELEGLNDEEIEEKAKKILAAMTLEEKVNHMAGDNGLIHAIGMMIRYNKNPIPAGVNKDLKIPGILFADGPRGIVLNSSTCFPVSMARGASWDIDLEERIGEIIGIEAKSQGANFFGGVCINLLRHPAWGRAQETYGEDSYHLGEMGAALTRGVQKHIMACAKHYACNSMENARFKVNIRIDERSLREIYLSHFKRCVEEGVASLMNAYNRVNGKYCGHNEHLLRDIAKNEWNFKGFIITDFLLGIRDGKKAIKAGVDIEMPFKWRMKSKKIIQWVKNGEISENLVDESVLRILRQLIRFAKKKDPNIYNLSKVASKEHIQVALEAARKSMVLLKNEDEILPISKKDIKKIAVIGTLANKENIGDLGSSRVYPPYVVPPLEGIIKEIGDSAEILFDNGKDLEKAKETAKAADYVIIVAGYTEKEEGEYVFYKGGDRDVLTLKTEDEKLILTLSDINPNCIVVMESGSVIITEKWREKVPGIIMVWYPGMEGGTALAEILFGKVNPSGKLPMVFPKSPDHLPFFNKDAEEIEYGYYYGYRLLEKEGNQPAFPFGFGLSYTSYTYSDLTLDREEISPGDSLNAVVNVSNEGKMEGEEIVELYVGYINSAVERHKKDLKRFKRINLMPGEKKSITFKIDSKTLAYYDTDSNEWVIEKITYNIYVGSSSKDEDLIKASFKIVK